MAIVSSTSAMAAPSSATRSRLTKRESGVRDRSTVLREAIRVYEEQLLLARMTAACEKYADESAAMAESFSAADSDLAA